MSTITNLFTLISKAKSLGSYPLANACFAILADKALDMEKEFSSPIS